VRLGSGGKAESSHGEDREVMARQTLGNADSNTHRETQAREQGPSMDMVGTGPPGMEVPAAPVKGAAALCAPAA
jgi:hypothetical protein